MKGRIISLAVVMLMVLGSFGAVGSLINQKAKLDDTTNNPGDPISAMGQMEERYDTYGVNLNSGEHCENYGAHAVRMTGWNILNPWAEYRVNIGCSDLGIKEGSLEVGVYFCDWGWVGDGPTVFIRDFENENWKKLGENIGNNDEYKWWWSGSISSSNLYVNDKDEVELRFECGIFDDTVIDMVSIKFTDNEETDQAKTEFDNMANMAGKYQSFTPQFQKLTRVKILLKADSYSGGSFFFYICSNMDPRDPITSTQVSPKFGVQLVFGPERWIEVDFGDNYVYLIPGRTYYLEVGSSADNQWCYKQSGQNRIYCYKTFGSETCNLEPTLDVSDNEINFGNVNKNQNPPEEILIKNTGDKGSVLQWEIKEASAWLDFSDDSGIIYRTHGSSYGSEILFISVDLSYLEGSKKGIEYSGSFKVVNKLDQSEYEKVAVKVTVIKSRSVDISPYNFVQRLIDQFPILMRLLHRSIW